MLSYNMIGHRFTQLFILDYEEYGIADYVGLFTDSEEEIEAHAIPCSVLLAANGSRLVPKKAGH